MPLQVLVAHSGKTFELDCHSNTRIDIIQEALASLTQVSAREQILICGGVKLDGARTLNAYGLPSEQENKHVFLYNKSGLKPGTAPPEVERIAPVHMEVPTEPSVHQVGHPLDMASSPLIRALPSYERQFKFHLQKGQAIWRASEMRIELCRRLVSEMRVQVLSIDSARQNVDIHFNYICKAYADFSHNYARQFATHAELLGSFEHDLEALRSMELHAGLRAPERRTLLDCVPVAKLRAWFTSCEKSHASFAAKVAELDAIFNNLKVNVEELFMTGPDVDVAQLEERLEDMQREEEEETSILQSLSKDLQTVQKLVEDMVGEMSHSSLSSSLRPVDACAALDPMNELHVSTHLPKIEECDAQLESLGNHLVECKVVLTNNVHAQLQSISVLQSKIRDLRCKLTAFKEVGSRQATAFTEFILVRQLPAQYKACLAEVVRRRMYAQLYAGHASQLAERMAHIREKEMARREAFTKQQERFLPTEVLEAMGLYTAPPQCEVTVPYNPESLLEVSDKELMTVYHESVPRGGSGVGSQRSSPIGRSPTQSPRVSPRTATHPAPVRGPASTLTAAAIAEAAAAAAVPAGACPLPSPRGSSVASQAGSVCSGVQELAGLVGDFTTVMEEELARDCMPKSKSAVAALVGAGSGGGGAGVGGGATPTLQPALLRSPRRLSHARRESQLSSVPATTMLELDNARLRAELAAHVALLAVLQPREKQTGTAGGCAHLSDSTSSASVGPGSSPTPSPRRGGDDVASAVESETMPNITTASAAAGGQQPEALSPEILKTVTEALSRKDYHCELLQRESDARRHQLEQYEKRIAALEKQLQLQAPALDSSARPTTPRTRPTTVEEEDNGPQEAGSTTKPPHSLEGFVTLLHAALDAAAMHAARASPESVELGEIEQHEGCNLQGSLPEDCSHLAQEVVEKTEVLGGDAPPPLRSTERSVPDNKGRLLKQSAARALAEQLQQLECAILTAHQAGLEASQPRNASSASSASKSTTESGLASSGGSGSGSGMARSGESSSQELRGGMKGCVAELPHHALGVVNSLLVLCTAWQQQQLLREVAAPTRTTCGDGGGLCYTTFELGMLAVFLPNASGHYEALHPPGGPGEHRYLAESCVPREGLGHGGRVTHVVGQILRDESAIAYGPPASPGNPYGLPQGTEYHILAVRDLRSQEDASSQ